MATKTSRFAWYFKSDLRWLTDLERRLAPISTVSWTKFDSDSRPDYLATKVSPHANVAIYDYGRAFVASVPVEADESELDAQLDAAKQLVLSKILPAIGAREIEETKPPDLE